MNVVDIPQPADRTVCEEAGSRYAGGVKSRAIGVHQLGDALSSALSGLALLVVLDQQALDNRFFFSALHRLPERYHPVLPCEPLILPGWSLRVIRYTTHAERRLLAGRDVIGPYSPSGERDELWCRVLESYCAHAAFVAKTHRSQLLKGRETLAAAEGLCRMLSDASPIMPETADAAYATAVEALRRSFFEEGNDAVEAIRTAWELFDAAFDRFDRALRERLNASASGEAVQTARARLRGDEECSDFDRDYAFRRARDIDGYRQELVSLGLPFGDLFSQAAHPQTLRPSSTETIVDRLLSKVYRVRRRITEHAAG